MWTTAPIATARRFSGAVPQIDRDRMPPGCVFCAVPRGNVFLDLVSGTTSYMSNTATPTTQTALSPQYLDGYPYAPPGTQTVGIQCNGVNTTGQRWAAQQTGLDFLTTTGSVFMLGGIVTETGSKMHSTIGCYDFSGNATTKSFMMYIDDGGSYGPGRIIGLIGAGSSSPNLSGTPDFALQSPTKNTMNFFGMGWDAGSSSVYYHGNLMYTAASLSVVAGTGRATTFSWGYGTAWCAWGALLLGFNRQLSRAEYAQLSMNPFAVLR